MACCTFKTWFIMADEYRTSSSNSHHHLIQQTTRNSQIRKYYLSFPLKRFELYKLSCSTKEGISSNLSQPHLDTTTITTTTTTTIDDDDDDDDDDDVCDVHHHHHHHQSKKEVICGNEAPLPPDYSAVIVQVNCEYEAPDLAFPWLTNKGVRRYNNGFIIEGRKLLTCAHCIEHHTNVTIRKIGSNTIYQATVIAISHDFDLAMLTVSDDEFWQGVGAVEFGGMPSLRDELTNMSYVQCTATITSSSGFISHMGMIPYSHGGLDLPGFEVSYDSEIAESGSGVFNVNGKCVGMAFHQDIDLVSNNPGRVIPVTIIKHFIQDYDRNGRCTGLPFFGVDWQKMENHDLRMSRRMQYDQEGVLIRYIATRFPELLVLKPDDVILSIDGVKIANDGTVPFVRGHRIDFNYLFTQRYTGDNVLVKVLRNSKVQHEKCGRSLMDEALNLALLKDYVVVSQVLDVEVNKGHAMVDIINQKVSLLNGNYVKGMNNLVSMVESCREEYVEFWLDDQKLVLNRIAAKKTTTKILEAYGIPSAMSDDLKCYREILREKIIPLFNSSKSDEYRLPLSR